jgi:P27 family predicted phage terminase small subunit
MIKNIKKEAKKLKKTILAEFEISDRAGLEILNRAMESYERMMEADERIRTEGLTILNHFGEPKENPLLNTSRKARAQFLLALKQLNLSIGSEKNGK